MLNKLTEQAAERFATMGDGVEDAQSQVLAIQRRISELERQIRNKGEAQGEETAVLQKDLDRLRERFKLAQETFLALSRVHTAIRTWIAQLPSSARLDDVEVGYGDTRSGEDYTDAVVRVRCDIEDLVRERSAILRAVPPVEELCAQADAHIDALAARGRPSNRLDGKVGGDQAAALLVWLFSDQIKKRLRGELQSQRKADPDLLVLSAAEREQRLASVEKLILAKERDEEWLVRDADQEGTTIPRREKASPLAILGLQFAPRARAVQRSSEAASAQ